MNLLELLSGWRGAGHPLELEPILWKALLLVGAALAGELIARTSRLPRVVGYTAAGMVAAGLGLGPSVPLVGTPRLVVDVALALLLFEVGNRIRLAWLRANPALLWTSLVEASCGAIAVFAGLRALDVEPQAAAACAALAMPASVAVAGRVALELEAAGQVTDRMTLLTGLNTLYAVLLLVVLNVWFQAAGEFTLLHALSALSYSLIGSLLLAIVLAGVVAAVTRRLDLRNENAVLLLLGLVVVAVSAARTLGISTLLVPLLAGATLRNSSDRPWVWPRHFGTAGGVVVLMLFVIVGGSWSPQALAVGGVAALALVAVRLFAKGLAVVLLAPLAGASMRQGFALAGTLIPLSATTLIMLTDLQSTAPAVGSAVAPILLSAVAVLELIGPIAVRSALGFAGEVVTPHIRARGGSR